MNKLNKNDFYILDFLKSLMALRNIPIILYLLIDSVFIFAALMILGIVFFGESIQNKEALSALCAVFALIIYVGAMILSFSPIGEMFLRFKNKCKKITDPDILNRIEPLFQEVYKKAKAESPNVSDNICLYIQEDEEANAFAIGRCTVCITTGLLERDDDEIKAILAHEFGHLANKDTDLILVVNVANTFIHLMFLLAWAVLFIFKLVMKIVAVICAFAGEGVATLFTAIFGAIYSFLAFICIYLAEKIWNIIGNLIINFSNRGSEYAADEFAKELGYGNELIKFFETLPDSYIGKKTTFKLFINRLATIGQSHPATWKRIEKLQNGQQDCVDMKGECLYGN